MRKIRLGGIIDTLSLTGVGSSLLFTSPFFASYPVLLTLSPAIVGGIWLGAKHFESFKSKPLLDSSVDVKSTSNLSVSKEGLLLGYATDTGKPIYLPENSTNSHGLVQGGSGVGKTVFLRSLAFQQIQRGGGLFFIDAKMDHDDLNTIYQYAVWCGRAQDVWVINPGDPSSSHTYNPILYGEADENADSVLSLIPASEDKPGPDHYRQSAKQALTTLFAALKAANLAYNFLDISILIQNQHALGDLEKRMKRRLPNHDATRNLSLFLEQFKGGFGNNEGGGKINVKRLKEMLGGIGSRMHTFGTGGFGKVANSYSPQVRFYEGMMQNKIIILRLPTMGKPDTAFAFAKMALADFRVAISWLQRLPSHQRPNPKFLGLFDEFGSYAMMAMAQPLEQGRSAGIGIWAFLQTFGQLNKIGLEFKQIVHVNTATKVFFKVLDKQSMDEASELIGEEENIKFGLNQTSRRSLSATKASIAPEGGVSHDMGLSVTESLEKEFRVDPDEIKNLAMGECLVLHEGEDLALIKVPLIEPTNNLQKEIGNIKLQHIKTRPVTGCDYFKNAEKYITSN